MGTYFLPVFPCFFLHNCRRKEDEMSRNRNITTDETANNIIIPCKYPEEWVRLQSANQNFARARCVSFVDNSRFWWFPGEDAAIPPACFATEEAVYGGDEKGEAERKRCKIKKAGKGAASEVVGTPVAATAAATACNAAGLALAALLGLAGTATNAGAAGAVPGASPAAATA